ncbi:MAG: ATP-binding cassette domain-containing protein [Myxococcales bacterium]|nr:ATP-binding cassette domain-containing protein [Myxococcales bacterium]
MADPSTSNPHQAGDGSPASDHPTEPTRHSEHHARQIAGIHNVEVGYDGRAILPPISVCMHAGELWALVGRNGAGKSTFMRTLLGLQDRMGGQIQLDEGVRVAYVAQRSEFEGRVPARVWDFVAGGLDVGWSFAVPWLSGSQRRKIAQAMADVRVEDLASRQMSTLSYGQRQRVHIARALATEPLLLVLDEPTSAMDPIAERAMFELLRNLARNRGISIMLSSHQMSFLPEHADHALLIDRDLAIATGGRLRDVFGSAAFRRVYGDIHVGAPTDDDCAS